MTRRNFLCMFLAAVAVRAVYALMAPAIFFNVDTEGYYNLGMQFFAHPSLSTLVTPYRTPLSGLFLNALFRIVGVGNAPFGSEAFLYGARIVVLLQMGIGALAFTVFYRSLTRLVPAIPRKIFGVFLLLDVLVIGWEHTLMTEGLAISISLCMTAVLLTILASPGVKNFLFFFLLFTIGFLLRPSFVIFPFVTLPIIAWYFRASGRVFFLCCVTLAASLLIPLSYAKINRTLYGYNGIQYVGDIDMLGKIIAYRLPVDAGKQYSYFYPKVDAVRSSSYIPTGFQFLQYYDPGIWDKVNRFVQLQAFNRAVILANLPLYLIRSAYMLPEVLREVSAFILVPASNPISVVQAIYGAAQYLTFAIPFLWIISVVVYLRKPNQYHTATLLIGTIALSQIVLTTLVVYHDVGEQYGRLLSFVQPQMYLYLLMMVAGLAKRRR